MTPDGSLRVALRPIPDEEGNDDPGIWGVVLADVARHACNMYSKLGSPSDKVKERIMDVFNAEIAKPTSPISGGLFDPGSIRGGLFDPGSILN
jgi:hypothetical protein